MRKPCLITDVGDGQGFRVLLISPLVGEMPGRAEGGIPGDTSELGHPHV